MLDVLIIGSGPAGLSAAVYAKRANLQVQLVEKEYLGTGQIADSSRVDNYLGMPGMSGYDIGEAFRAHAEQLGVAFVDGEVTEIQKNGDTFVVTLEDGTTIEAKTLVYAAGCKHRKLGVDGETDYLGKGISFCAVCDGSFYKGKTASVIGGGDTALDDALYLSDICENVYLIHRRDTFRGSAHTLEKLQKKDNVKIITNEGISSFKGDKKVQTIVLSSGKEVQTDGVFEAVGMLPQTELLQSFGVLDANGYVIADETCKTSVDGLFAAGDVRTKRLRQVITAAADGACAIQSVLDYMN